MRKNDLPVISDILLEKDMEQLFTQKDCVSSIKSVYYKQLFQLENQRNVHKEKQRSEIHERKNHKK